MRKAYLAMAIVSLALGLMISIQYRSSFNNTNILSSDQWAEMTAQTEHLRNQHDALINERNSLRAKLAATGAETQSAVMQELLKQADIAAGLTPVTGPGIVLCLNDRSNTAPTGEIFRYHIIYYNLMILVNELKASGADAISLNGERIVATTGISSSGSKMLVNGNPIEAPYKIVAIGKPETLESALKIKDGEAEALASTGVEVTIQRSDNIEIPAFNGSTKYQYARTKKI